LKGITQTQINPKIDLTFARVLRSMLRHDPDIMMSARCAIGETADCDHPDRAYGPPGVQHASHQ